MQQSKFQKSFFILILAFMSAIAPLSTDMYLPALSSVKQTFQTSEFYTQLSLSAFFVAFALGQLIYGPISDVFGRKKPLLAGIALFIVSSILCVSIDNIYAFIFFRFTQALGGCAGVVMARAIINDKFDIKTGAAVLALMMIVGSLAPMLAPTFGAFISDFGNWKLIFATLFGLGILLFLMILFGLDESGIIDKTLTLRPITVLRNYATILKDKRFFIFTLSSSLTMAAMFAYIAGSSFVFRDYFGLSSKTYGAIFGLNALSMTIFSAINAKLVQKISPYKILQTAFLLMIAMGIMLLLCAVFDFGFVAFEICLFFTLGMKGLIIPNSVVLAMARFRGKSGSASAVLGAIQMAFAGLISAFVGAIGANYPSLLSTVMLSAIICGYLAFITLFLKRKFKKFANS